MGDTISHRGPDDAGCYVDDFVAFGMRRLSIIDVDGGHQPISNEDKTIWVICNGEIYNYRELRLELEKKGHVFRCHSDTEVIVHLYEEEGTNLFRRLRGMFAIAVWDKNRRRLVLARDRLGKKPLYVTKGNGRLLFSSELKAILKDFNIQRRINLASLQEYLELGYVPGPHTLIDGIEKILPGHFLVLENGRVSQESYWDLASQRVDSKLSEAEWIDQVREKLFEAVRIRLVSDVPLGAFLSGGIDSSSVVAAMAQLTSKPVKTYSIGFEGEDSFYNELPYARAVSQAFGTDHHEIIVKPDVAELLPELIWYLDEPVADSAFVTTFLVSKLASKSVKVILSGVGGDELFGGYRRYLGDNIARYYRHLPEAIRLKWLPALMSHLPQDRHSKWKNFIRYSEAFIKSSNLPPLERYANYVTLFSPEACKALENADRLKNSPTSRTLQYYFDQCPAQDNLAKYIYLDLKTSLPDDLLALTDKMTMAMSLECRAPFMDHELVELAASIPPSLKVNGLTTKYILKKAVQPWLPREILHRKKRGFGAPMGAWLRRDLKTLVQNTLSEERVRARGLFHWPVIRELIQKHELQKADHTDHLLALINLELWSQRFIDNGIATAPMCH
jgi:asparagine synthase (glutamine-hydrolysing)